MDFPAGADRIQVCGYSAAAAVIDETADGARLLLPDQTVLVVTARVADLAQDIDWIA